MDALTDRGASEELIQKSEISVSKMIQKLEQVSEETWGKYAFVREPLEGKFTEEQKSEYIRKANACGRQWAEWVADQYKTRNPKVLAEKMGIKVKEPKMPTGGGVVLFAQYIQPDEITIFTDCVERASQLEQECRCLLLKPENLMNILLAHELFHAVEEQHQKEIYTRTEKVELWRKPFSNQSCIVCLSEIAAMAFAEKLLKLEVSPYMLDVLLVYSYDKNVAISLYKEICTLCENE